MTKLRVIAGKARGHRLLPVPGDTTRPITDRAKESLFNILGADIQEAKMLDLFAGTGSVGIEALSRGASSVTFLDKNHLAIQTIHYNLKITGFEQMAQVLRIDAFTFLERPANQAFEYIFIAPPQYQGLWKRALTCIDENPSWMTDDSWVIIQIHPVEYEKTSLQNLIEFDQRLYGSVMFVFYQRK